MSLADPLLLGDDSQYRETDQPCGPCHSNRHAVQVAIAAIFLDIRQMFYLTAADVVHFS